jgi:hypothetical protein
LHLRYFKAGGVFLGAFSHLALDEIYSVQWTSGRWRFKSSFGTALKLWGDSAWDNFSVYSKLLVVAVLILSEPMIMEQYGQLSPVVINTEAIREKLRLMPGAPVDPAQVAAASTMAAPQPMPSGTVPWNVGPTTGTSPDAAQDRNIYDTARRIWERFTH